MNYVDAHVPALRAAIHVALCRAVRERVAHPIPFVARCLLDDKEGPIGSTTPASDDAPMDPGELRAYMATETLGKDHPHTKIFQRGLDACD